MIKKILANSAMVMVLTMLLPTASMALGIGGYPIIYKGSLNINTLLNGVRNSDLAGSLLTLRLILNQWGGGRCVNNGGQSTPANGIVFTPGVELEVFQSGVDFTTTRGKYLSEFEVTDEELLDAFLNSGITQPQLDALCPNSTWHFDASTIQLVGFDLDAIGSFCVDGAGKTVPCPDSGLNIPIRPEDRVGARYLDDGTASAEQPYTSQLLCDGLKACKTYFGFDAPTIISY